MAAFCKLVLIIAGFGSCVQSATHNYRPLRYTVPKPLIQAFRPEGLKVSIPHTPGIQLFAFHGNINKPLDGREMEELGTDVDEREGDLWQFKNSTVTLRVGDVIYYRIFVVKDSLGYRIQDGMFEISELYRDGSSEFTTTTIAAPTTPPAPVHGCTICENVVLNITQKLFDLQQEIDSLRETNDVLKELLQNFPKASKTLILDGVKVQDDELVVIVQTIIRDKLHLPIKIDNVTKTKSGLVRFDVDSVDEKVQIILAANKELKDSKFKIIY